MTASHTSAPKTAQNIAAPSSPSTPSSPSSPPASPLEGLFKVDWQQLLWRTGCVAWPAIAICLLLSQHDAVMSSTGTAVSAVSAEVSASASAHHVTSGAVIAALFSGGSAYALSWLVAAGGAFSVGMGAMQRFTRFSLAPMVLACLGMMLSTWAGSMLGHSLAWLLIASAGWALLGGIASLWGPGLTWICQQSTIALFVAGSFPGAEQAVGRAAMVGIGGAIQIVLLGILIVVFPRLRPPETTTAAMKTLRPVAVATALRSAISAVLALVIARAIGLNHAYWAPMTALVVLKPSLNDEFHSVLQRCLGTIGGAVLASVLISFADPGPLALIVLTCALAALAYTMNRVSYLYFSAGLTAYIVAMLSFANTPAFGVTVHRIIATVLGCGVALSVDYLLKLLGIDASRKTATGVLQSLLRRRR